MTKKVKTPQPRLLQNNLSEASFKRLFWHVTCENDITIETLLNPEYWTHVARNFKAGHLIQVVPRDRSFFAEFFVLGASSAWVKVVLLRNNILIENKESAVILQGYKITWAGTHQWRVTKGTEIYSKDHETKELAEAWLAKYKKDNMS